MKTNTSPVVTHKTHEGAPAKRLTPEQELRRSVLACMLWENTFYEDGVTIAERIKTLVTQVKPRTVAELAVEAREKMKLRHAPLWIVRAMAQFPEHKALVADTLATVIQRADELSEFVALYWKDKRQPLSAQVKKGLARAFLKFSAYELAKYNRDTNVRLRDVLFLCHPKPQDEAQAEVWKQLASNTLPIPDTWEVALSTGKDKKETWERLISERKLGALAFLRNLRNMAASGVDDRIVISAFNNINFSKVLPFRFIAAAKHAPQWEGLIETAMLRCLEGLPRLNGKTVLLIDVSGSMDEAISGKSDLMRYDAANGLAILARELCEAVEVYSFSNSLVQIPARRGFALRDAIAGSQAHRGTYLGRAVTTINENVGYDRLIVLTDEQSHDAVPNPKGKGYMVNVAAYENGIGYGVWHHIDGWSEAIFDYMMEHEHSGW